MRIIFIVFVTVLTYDLAMTETCQKVDSCRCTYTNSHIDLTPLISASVAPRFKDMYDQYYNSRFSYNPCDSFDEGTCTDVAVCKMNLQGQTFNVGNQDTAAFIDSDYDNLMIEYTAQNGQTSRVQLICSYGSTTLEVNGENPSGVYNFKLRSPYCCPVEGSLFPSQDIVTPGLMLLIGLSTFSLFAFLLGLICYTCAPKSPSQESTPRNSSNNGYLRMTRAGTPPPYSAA
nr:cation-dependent mannose-6-phosphate receptor isoform X1 [Biomphalaria glabrata]